MTKPKHWPTFKTIYWVARGLNTALAVSVVYANDLRLSLKQAAPSTSVKHRMRSNLLKKFDQLRAAYPDEAILFHDERRAGTRTELGRKWAPMGHRPVAPVKIGYENVDLYLTLCPFTGEGFAAFLPKLDGDQFGWFIEQVQACLGQKSLFIADGATAHKAELFDKEKLTFVRLPAACPELNPVEGFFKEVRRGLKNRVFDSLPQAQEKIQQVVEKLADQVISLTCFPYLKVRHD